MNDEGQGGPQERITLLVLSLVILLLVILALALTTKIPGW